MATVRIGERELDVWHRQQDGGLGKSKRVILAELALRKAPVEEIPDRWADLIGCYVGHNEGVTVDWLLKTLPADCRDVNRACMLASGLTPAEPAEATPGEATSP
jgi:hypothetical protein